MGGSYSLIAVAARTPEQIAAATGHTLGGERIAFEDAVARSRSVGPSVWSTGGAWAIVADPHRAIQEPRVVTLSRGTSVLVLDVEDHVMHAELARFVDGRLDWRVAHPADPYEDGPQVVGAPPLPAAMTARIASGDVRAVPYELPAELFAELTGIDGPAVDAAGTAFTVLDDPARRAPRVLAAWRDAERRALAGLGFEEFAPDCYRIALVPGAELFGLFRYPKQARTGDFVEVGELPERYELIGVHVGQVEREVARRAGTSHDPERFTAEAHSLSVAPNGLEFGSELPFSSCRGFDHVPDVVARTAQFLQRHALPLLHRVDGPQAVLDLVERDMLRLAEDVDTSWVLRGSPRWDGVRARLLRQLAEPGA